MTILKAEQLAIINNVFNDAPNEKEAYVHGYTDAFLAIDSLSKEYPNDTDFGAAVRRLFSHER
jgi:hypothetical protein